MRHRPIGIGVQGLADAFILMDIPFHSEEAKVVNKKIFETIYYGAIVESCEQAKLHGPYESFPDSPASHGLFNLIYGVMIILSHCGYDWKILRK